MWQRGLACPWEGGRRARLGGPDGWGSPGAQPCPRDFGLSTLWDEQAMSQQNGAGAVTSVGLSDGS